MTSDPRPSTRVTPKVSRVPLAGRPVARLTAGIAVLLALVLAVVGGIRFLGDTGGAEAAEDLPSSAPVDPNSRTRVDSDDGKVTVDVPVGTVAGQGIVSVEPGNDRDGREGWSVELRGTRLTGAATLRFKMPQRAKGEPLPLVRYADAPGRRKAPFVANAKTDGDELVVRTDHFSLWFLDAWGQALADAKDRVADKLDQMASLSTTGKRPHCDGEADVRDAGYKVTSDSGRRVYWCLGSGDGGPVLKVVNGRGYGVAAEYAPGLSVAATDRQSFLDVLANLMRPAPTRRVNKVELIPPGNTVDFAVAGQGRTAVAVTLNAPAYLLTALQFAIDTVAMLLRQTRATNKGPKQLRDHLLTAMQAEKCLNSMTSMAAKDLTTPADASAFFGDALSASFDCAADAIDGLDVGVINQMVVAPLMWLVSGLATVANGIVGAADGLTDLDGYQIKITPPIEQATEQVVIDPFTDTGIKPDWRLDTSTSDANGTIDCEFDEGSVHAVGPSTHQCGGTADAANACWSSQFDTSKLWCLNTLDVNDRTLRAYQATDSVDDDTAAPEVPEPLFLELEDGSTWWYRTGGSWGGRADDLVGAYGCMNEEGVCADKPAGTDGSIILVPQEGNDPTIDRSRSAWRVRVGLLGDPNTDYPPPTWMSVTKAWFIAGHRWQGD